MSLHKEDYQAYGSAFIAFCRLHPTFVTGVTCFLVGLVLGRLA